MDFNDLFILECFYNQADREFFDLYTIPSLKDFTMSARFQFLKKNDYLVEDPNDTSKIIISVKGREFIEDLLMPSTTLSDGSTARMMILDVGKTQDEMFDEWWKTFPSTTAWTSDDGAKFVGSRHLKNITKAAAKKKYLKVLNQGISHEDLLGGLKYEIKMKKLESIKKNENKMDFFKGMESYLNQEVYLQTIELYKQNPDFVKDVDVKSKKQNVRDI